VKKVIYIWTVLILVTGLLLAACPGPAPTPPTTPTTPEPGPQYGGVLKVITGESPVIIGYPIEMRAAELYASQPALEGLFVADKMGRIKPCLATAWEIAPDLKSITLTLRRDVKFHDGTDFDAQAVKWNLDQVKGTGASWFASVTSIDIVGKYTVRINLSSYTNTLLDVLASNPFCRIISPTAVTENGLDWARTHPVGTGPFRFVSFQRDVSVTYARFDGYWDKGKPYLDGIEIKIIPETMTASASFKVGEGEIYKGSTSVGGKEALDLAAAGFEVVYILSGQFGLLGDSVNAGSVYANKTVREAIEYAIDREAIAKALGYGFWQALNQPCPPGFMGYIPDLKGRPYDPMKARQLLSEAGYPNGFRTTIIAPVQYANRDCLVAIQSYLGKIGIVAEIDLVAYGAWAGYLKDGWSNALVTNMMTCSANYTRALDTSFPGIIAGAYAYSSGLRPAGYKELLAKALAAADYETQRTLTQGLVRMLYDEATYVPLYAYSLYVVKHKFVHDDNHCVWHMSMWTPADVWLSK
jgi:peptide/nickel transport system substrate-binding protein